MKNSLLAVVLFALLAATTRAEAQEPTFKVVVNARVSTSSLSEKEVSKIFLKKTTAWPSGLKITAVNLGVEHPVREAFSQRIHGKGAHPIERRWETLIFSGMGVPPLKLSTEAEVVAFIRSNAGAIGYVAADTRLPDDVKALEITR